VDQTATTAATAKDDSDLGGTTSKTKRIPVHKNQMSRKTLDQIKDHKQFFRSLRPKGRQVQFNPHQPQVVPVQDPAAADVDDMPTPLCHVQNLSWDDLNLPCMSPATQQQNKVSACLLGELPRIEGDGGGGDSESACPSLCSVSVCSHSVCSARSDYESKRQAKADEKKNKARIHKLEIEIDSNISKTEYLDDLLAEDQEHAKELERANQELRRQIVVAAGTAAMMTSWSGLSHQQMLAEETKLRQQLQTLEEEIFLLGEEEQQQLFQEEEASMSDEEDSDKPTIPVKKTSIDRHASHSTSRNPSPSPSPKKKRPPMKLKSIKGAPSSTTRNRWDKSSPRGL